MSSGNYTRDLSHLNASNRWQYVASQWMLEHHEIPIAICVVYVLVIFGIRRVMKDKEEFSLTGLLGIWNILLAAFSFIGACYVLPATYRNIQKVGVTQDICDPVSELENPWVLLFCLSKIPELIDTLFIVLRKRPLIFLHWYHHVATLLFCWNAWALQIGTGGWFAGMNLCIHTIMYSYYAACAFGARFSKPIRLSITALQILQMVGGLAIIFHTMRYCFDNPVNTYCGLIMYASYMVLFVKLFIESLQGDRRKRKPSGRGEGKEKAS